MHNFIIIALLSLIAVMNFVHTAKLAQSHNWSPKKTRFFIGVDCAFALLITTVVVAVLNS